MPTNRLTHVYCKGNSVEMGQSSTNGVGTIGHPYSKNRTSFHISQGIQKLTQSGLYI